MGHTMASIQTYCKMIVKCKSAPRATQPSSERIGERETKMSIKRINWSVEVRQTGITVLVPVMDADRILYCLCLLL